MTWTSTQGPVDWQKNLLDFIKSDQALALGTGLLNSKSPYFGGALGEGFQGMLGQNRFDRHQKVPEGYLDIEKNKADQARRQSEQFTSMLGQALGGGQPKDNSFFNNSGNFGPQTGGQQMPGYVPQATPAPQIQTPQPSVDQMMQNIAQANPGLLGQAPQAQQRVMPSAMPQPPAAPMPPPAPIQQAQPQAAPRSAGRGGDMVTLPNGLQVPRQRALEAQMIASGPGGVEAAIKHLTKPDDQLTDIEKRAKAVYGTLDSEDAKQFIKDATLRPSNQVNVSLGDKTMNKVDETRLLNAAEEALNVSAQLENLDLVENALDKVKTGSGAPLKLAAMKADQWFNLGFTDPEETAALTFLQKNQATQQRLDAASMKGQVPQRELDILIKAVPGGLENTVEGNKLLVKYKRADLLRKQQRDDFLSTYYEQNGTTAGASKKWEDFKRDNPIIYRDDNGDVQLDYGNIYNWDNPRYLNRTSKSVSTLSDAELDKLINEKKR